jgi:23S rRNA (adenine2030-N6)-methyltransferase
MLSYQHAYHAGCYADVLKHFTLSRLLSYMTQKDKPLFYLETHGGRGRYDLNDKMSQKTGEADLGIQKLWPNISSLPEIFKPFLSCFHDEGKRVKHYPGSPQIAIELLRPIDRIYLCELHSTEFSHLKFLPAQGRKVFTEQADGMEKLLSLTPPPEKRGLFFIDPSFEMKDEYQKIPKTIAKAYQKFPQGVYVLWYPIINQFYHEKLIKGMARIPSDKHLKIEFYHDKIQKEGMNGTGLWIINPPYTLKEEATTACQIFKNIFNPGVSSFIVE